MKRFILFSLVSLFSLAVQGQIEFGVKAGLSSYDLANDGILVDDGSQTLEWKINHAGIGHHFGVYSRFTLLGIYIEPALLFNSNSVEYNIKNYTEAGVFSTIRNEKYNHADIPILAGIKLGILRFQGGIVGHFFINSISDVVDIKDYQHKIQNATYGWQAGTGLDVWKLRFDLNFEGNLKKFGDSYSIAGHDYAFADTPGRMILSVGYKF